MGVTGRSNGGRIVALVVVVAALATVGTAAAPGGAVDFCTKTWATPVSGSWTDGSRWSGGTVPQPSDRVCITVAGTYTVSLAGSVSVATLDVGEAFLTTGPTLEIGVGGDTPVTISSIVTVGGTLRALQPLVVQGPLTVEGTFAMADGVTVTQRLWTRHGTTTGHGQLHAQDLRIGDMDVVGDGNGPNGAVVGHGGVITFDGDGDVIVRATGTVDVYGSVSARTAVLLDSTAERPSALRMGANFASFGRIRVRNGRGQPADLIPRVPDTTLINYGELEISPLVDPSGHVPSTTTADIDIVNVGEIDSGDPWAVTQDLVNEGEIYLRVPGLEVGGDLRQRPSGILHHRIDDSYPDVPVTVTGTAALDGTLRTEGFQEGIAIGEHRPVIRAGARTGPFRHHEMNAIYSFDIAYDGPDVDVVRRESETPLHDLVRASYDDLLGRPPTASELATTVADINAGRLSRGSLLRRLARATEHLAFVVDEIYIDALGVHADPAGRAFWVDQLQRRRRTVAQVTAEVHASAAAFARADGLINTWVVQRFDPLLGRPPLGSEIDYWGTRANAVGRRRAALELFSSLEARRYRIGVLYETMLRRPAGPAEAAYWTPRLAVEGDLVLVAFVAASAEYARTADLRYP